MMKYGPTPKAIVTPVTNKALLGAPDVCDVFCHKVRLDLFLVYAPNAVIVSAPA